jgi:hypothetical protein
MKIEYKTGNGKTEAILSEEADWELFNQIANLITKEFNVKWVGKADGLDQRYWDFEIENVRLTLHLERYLGISLFPTKVDNANHLVQRTGSYLEANIPATVRFNRTRRFLRRSHDFTL